MAPWLGRCLRVSWLLVAIPLLLVFLMVEFSFGSYRLHVLWQALQNEADVGPRWLAVAMAGAVVFTYLIRSRRVPVVPALALCVSFMIIFGVTWLPTAGGFGLRSDAIARLVGCASVPPGFFTVTGGTLYDFVPNIVLYVPPAFFLAMHLPRHIRRIWLWLIFLSAVTESYQAVFTDRSCQVTDLAANTMGALLGVLFAAGLYWVRPTTELR
jgi:VanZ like family